MNIRKQLAFRLALTVLSVVFLGNAKAQQLNCEKLKEIINVVAVDSTLQSLKGEKTTGKYSSANEYNCSEMLWKPDDYIMQSQYIRPDEAVHRNVYSSIYDDGSIDEAQKEETRKIIKMLVDCLGGGWIQTTQTDEDGAEVTYLKNPANYVIIKIANEIAIDITCYRGRNVPECITGDCGNYWGGLHFFTEDTYGGTFVDGTLSGVGRVNWYANKTFYMGSLIDNQLAGYGAIYDENNQVLKKGFFFKGDTVTFSRYKDGCQLGNCQDGFGAKMIFNNIYIGNFKGGLPNGLGETIIGSGDTEAAFFGHYKNGHDDGKGIFINAKGNYTFGTFSNGVAKGKYEVDLVDKTSIETHADNTSSYFGEDNILIKEGTGGSSSFVEKSDPAYLGMKAAAVSLKEFYGYRQTGYKEIIGEQSRTMKLLGMQGGYKSNLLFQKMYEATIDVDHDHHYYITVYLSGKSADKLKWVSLYNKYYGILNDALGNRWVVTTNGGKVSVKKPSGNLVLKNMFDKSKVINLSIDARGVQMELH